MHALSYSSLGEKIMTITMNNEVNDVLFFNSAELLGIWGFKECFIL